LKRETIYGVRPVIEALRGGRREVFEVMDASRNAGVEEAAAASGVFVKEVPRARVDELARGRAHQGVVARVGPYPYSGLAEILAAPSPLLVVLDGVTDPRNLGAVLRAADGAQAGGVWVYAAELGGTAYTEVDLSGPIALVLGSEGRGVRRLVREGCDGALSIPMLGSVGSLNVSVAAAVLLYEARRQRGWPRT
jgi:23S rRNA (guanosine2251-2'-O)-methyltransferase